MCTCIIPGYLHHDTVTVHTFISVVLSHIKTEIPLIKKVVYSVMGLPARTCAITHRTPNLTQTGTFFPLVMAEVHVMELEALLNVLLPGPAFGQQHSLIF